VSKHQETCDTVVAVLAGGQGSRFWPMSRSARPKQFLSIKESGESLIQSTVRRVEGIASAENVWVISNPGLVDLITEHVPKARIVCEPVARNTAPCVGLAAVHALVHSKGVDPVMVVLPADHAVKDEERLRSALREAIDHARRSKVLVTIGIPPTHPHTGYGYIKRGVCIEGRTYNVQRFFEKPNMERATKYVEDGSYSWNSGMFVWRASVILEAFKAYLPTMYDGLMEIKQLLESGMTPAGQEQFEKLFSGFESISIDFGVLEHASNCLVVTAEEFGWNDVGSWDQWAESFKTDVNGNLLEGDSLVIDSTRCVVRSDKRLIAAVGLTDIIIIDAGDALLVVSRDHVQEVRKVVEELKRRGRTELT
jgi:mannose-1-phosphate guanylyltransferase